MVLEHSTVLECVVSEDIRDLGWISKSGLDSGRGRGGKVFLAGWRVQTMAGWSLEGLRDEHGEQSQGSWHSIATSSHDPRQGIKTLGSAMLGGSIGHSVLYIWTIAPGEILGELLVVLFG